MIDLLRDPIWQSIGAILAFLGVVGAVYIYYSSSLEQSRKYREKIDQAESRVEAQPEKIKPAWDLARVFLGSLLQQESQPSNLYILALCICHACWICYHYLGNRAGGSVSSWNIASSDYWLSRCSYRIGATFLFIYRSTMEQAVNYTKTLERINSVGMAMQILDTIPNNAKDDNLRNSTKAAVVKMLMQQAYSIEVPNENMQEGKKAT